MSQMPPSSPPPGTPPYGGGPSSGGGPSPSTSPKGFFAALFDFSFTTFITPMIVKFVYILATAVIGLLFLVFLFSAFSQSALAGFFVLVLGPVVALIYLAFIRMTLEFYLAVTRMSQDINQRLPRS